MLRFTLLIALFPLAASAQNCDLKSSVDPFTHEKKLSTGFINFNRGSINYSVSVDATPGLVDFFIWMKGKGYCFDADSYAEIMFEGERSKLRLKNTGSMNCEGAFHFSFRNTATPHYQLNKLASKPVASINLVGPNKSETFITLTEEQQKEFQAAAACVAQRAPELAPR